MKAEVITDSFFIGHYKIANKYYGNPRFWWVIAWYNGYPTEADVKKGAYLEIPVNLEDALRILGL